MNTKKFVYWASVATLGIVLGVSLQFVKAWTEPVVAPPNGNVSAPINTGLADQTKDGDICTNKGGTVKCLSSAGSTYTPQNGAVASSGLYYDFPSYINFVGEVRFNGGNFQTRTVIHGGALGSCDTGYQAGDSSTCHISYLGHTVTVNATHIPLGVEVIVTDEDHFLGETSEIHHATGVWDK